MKENLRKSVFWYGMSSDLEKFVTQCPQCQTSEQSAVTVETDKQDSVLEERVKLFQDYFAGKVGDLISPRCVDVIDKDISNFFF